MTTTAQPRMSSATQKFLARPHGARIGIDEVFAASGDTLESIDPSTGRPIASIAACGAREANLAAAQAREAFEDTRWRRVRPAEQGNRLLALAELVDSNATELAELDVLDMGMPISVARNSVADAAALLRYYAGWPTKIEGSVAPGSGGVLGFALREPVGVCVGITPWNAPLTVAVGKIAPALACGNTVIVKPAEQSSLSALRLAELCLEAGIPPGIVNVVPGLGEILGAALVEHPGVDKIAFTGSTEVGKHIQATAAKTLKRVTLELGGKSPSIVFSDADLDKAATVAAANIWANAGQTCYAGTRIFAQHSVRDQLTELLVEKFRAIRLGPGLDPRTQMGPLVSAEQLQRVTGYLDLGRKEGAEVRLGGSRVDGPGYFVEPTVFAGVENGMRIAREEIFGPVISVLGFQTEEEAIALANDSPYGLGAGVWTKELGRAIRVTRGIRSGVVWVNTYGLVDHAMPFGGFKQSGYGREFGRPSIDAYTEYKSVYIKI
jgi:acyl-CoA reductase-like NAD-dependent aldehyde dehydrogenase